MVKIELYDEPTILSLREVAEQLVGCGGISIEADEEIGECRLEFGADLEVDINRVIKGDPRCSGY